MQDPHQPPQPPTITPPFRTIQPNPHIRILYSTLHKIPLAVYQYLDLSIIEGNAARTGMDFFKETHIKDSGDSKFFVDDSFFLETEAYRGLHLDKGHMAAARNYAGNLEFMKSTYTYANCIPQNSYFNRGTWKNLESYCRSLLRKNLCQTVQVISGPIFYSNRPYSFYGTPKPNTFQNRQLVLLPNGLTVPPRCYKIIKANTGTGSYVSAFVFDNAYRKDNEELLASHLVSLDQLEFMTGLRFGIVQEKGLEKLDQVGMAKTLGDLHREFYEKLYLNSQFLTDMSNALKQAASYSIKIDINIIPVQQRQCKAHKQIQNTLNQVGWTRMNAKCRRKINALLTIHKDAYELQTLNQEIENKIRNGIMDNLEGAKKEQDKMYYKAIAKKLYYRDDADEGETKGEVEVEGKEKEKEKGEVEDKVEGKVEENVKEKFEENVNNKLEEKKYCYPLMEVLKTVFMEILDNGNEGSNNQNKNEDSNTKSNKSKTHNEQSNSKQANSTKTKKHPKTEKTQIIPNLMTDDEETIKFSIAMEKKKEKPDN